jgi:hypothetical protein
MNLVAALAPAQAELGELRLQPARLAFGEVKPLPFHIAEQPPALNTLLEPTPHLFEWLALAAEDLHLCFSFTIRLKLVGAGPPRPHCSTRSRLPHGRQGRRRRRLAAQQHQSAAHGTAQGAESAQRVARVGRVQLELAGVPLRD